MKKIIAILLGVALLAGCAQKNNAGNDTYKSRFDKENTITVSDEKITFNGKDVTDSGDVFVSNDIVYYEDKQTYESGNAYGEGGEKDRHTKAEADAHTVLNITKSGAYRVSGKLSAGQIRVDLGEDAKINPDAVVELILDGADITCTVAPAILFESVYECDGNWSVETAKPEVDTSAAGAVLVLAKGSNNTISGSYVAKIFKDGGEEKKLWKQDGAIYSYMSMNVCGGGEMTLNAENEGLDTELHLTINGGNINIYSQNDGINTNEDNVSVTTVNGGNIKIIAGLGQEGDGIDSNGWIVINGGNLIASANAMADTGLDSDKGSYINGGTVVAFGSTMDWPEKESGQVMIGLQFAKQQSVEKDIVIKNEKENVVFSYEAEEEDIEKVGLRNFRGAVLSSPELEVEKDYTIYVDGNMQAYSGTGMRGGFGGFGGGMRPGGMPKGERPQMPGGEMPKGEMPDRPEGEFPGRPDGEFPQMPEGERPQRPEGGIPKGEGRQMPEGEFQGKPRGEMPQMPEGGVPDMPRNGEFPARGNGWANDAELQTVFHTSENFNMFSGVTINE